MKHFSREEKNILLEILQKSVKTAAEGEPEDTQLATLVNQVSSQETRCISYISSCVRYSKYSNWILDFGAMDHIANNLKLFSISPKIEPMIVNLTDGTLLTAQYASTVQFSSTITLTNVLYLPDFHFNLISIPKIFPAVNCCLTFYQDHCLIQNMNSMKAIGSGEGICLLVG